MFRKQLIKKKVKKRNKSNSYGRLEHTPDKIDIVFPTVPSFSNLFAVLLLTYELVN